MKVLHVFTLSTTARSFFDGQFRYLSDHGHDLHMISSDPEDTDFCRRNRLAAYHRSEVARRIDIRADIRAIADIRRYIRRNGINAVVGHTPKGAMVAMIAAWLARVPVRIYYRHGLIYTTATGLRRAIFKNVERLTAALATRIVNVSPSLSALAVKDHLNSGSKQTVIGAGTCGGIDTAGLFNPEKITPADLADIRCRYGIGDDTFTVGFCGRICRDKGIIELIGGFNEFRRRHPGLKCRLLVVGPYDSRDILPQAVRDILSDDPDIVLTGNVGKSQLPVHYAAMDVFVFPSYREGFGMTVIEASAMEVPVLVSRSHGCVDSIRENVSGIYIGISDKSIADKLDMLYNTPELRRSLGAGGRKFVIENFERTTLWPEILKMYNSTMHQ